MTSTYYNIYRPRS